MESFAGKRVTVMGLGRFGGGVGVTRWLAGGGAQVLVTDLLDADALKESIAQIQDLIDSGAVGLRLGEHREEDFAGADVVVANPAVPKPWENRYLRAAEDAGVPITTEIRLTVERLPNRERVIGVTGTAGKSTTAAMIAHVLRKCGESVHLGGNIGGSLLGAIESMGETDWVVLEVSSAQLYWLDRGGGWAPRVMCMTNIAPNHLDWHGSFEHYRASKLSFVDAMRSGDVVVCGDALGIKGEEVCRAEGVEVSLPGVHNLMNGSCAVGAVMAAHPALDRAGVVGAVRSFGGLPHRLQFVGEFGGVRVFNDSKCTTPEACALAVGAFDEEGECGAGRVHLICGGYDKQVDLAPMVEAAARCAGVYTIGATGQGIAEAVNARAAGKAEACGTLEAAVERAGERITRVGGGGVLLLSPGCASWDQFRHFEERGEKFIALAQGALEDHRKR